jgi:hypothetical protein
MDAMHPELRITTACALRDINEGTGRTIPFLGNVSWTQFLDTALQAAGFLPRLLGSLLAPLLARESMLCTLVVREVC